MSDHHSHVESAETSRLLKLATYASVTTAGILIAVKLVAYVTTNSVSVLASLIDSLLDAGASIINLFAVRYALEPPDSEHRFGHGKAESIAGLAQAMFIGGSGLFLIIESVDRWIQPRPINELGVGLAVMGFAIAATLVLLAIQCGNPSIICFSTNFVAVLQANTFSLIGKRLTLLCREFQNLNTCGPDLVELRRIFCCDQFCLMRARTRHRGMDQLLVLCRQAIEEGL